MLEYAVGEGARRWIILLTLSVTLTLGMLLILGVMLILRVVDLGRDIDLGYLELLRVWNSFRRASDEGCQ